MSPFLEAEEESVSTYDLVSVICHHGTPASGHYIAYCLNTLNDRWYEFDDQEVTGAEPHHVASCEPYVLFYRKSSPDVYQRRLRVVELAERLDEQENMPQAITCQVNEKYFLSNQWIFRFNHLSDPGPVDNTDFACPHGGVKPSKIGLAEHLATPFPKEIWQYLMASFGESGGPVCLSLDPCHLCSLLALPPVVNSTTTAIIEETEETDELKQQKSNSLAESRQIEPESVQVNEPVLNEELVLKFVLINREMNDGEGDNRLKEQFSLEKSNSCSCQDEPSPPSTPTTTVDNNSHCKSNGFVIKS